jgi:STAS domain
MPMITCPLTGLCWCSSQREATVADIEESAEPPPASDGPATIIVHLADSISPAGIPLLCERLQGRLAGTDVEGIACDASRLADPDLTTIEVVARMQLTAGRNGRWMHLQHASQQLLDLLSLVGLSEVVAVGTQSGLDPGRQTEQGKQARVDEVVEPGDAPG